MRHTLCYLGRDDTDPAHHRHDEEAPRGAEEPAFRCYCSWQGETLAEFAAHMHGHLVRS